jgi:putative serine protease PepD
VFVPAWVAAVVVVLLVAALGFLVGWIAAPGDDSSTTNASATAPSSRPVPNFPGNGNGSTGNGTNGGSTGNGSTGNGSTGNGSTTAPSQSGAFMGIAVESATDGGTGAQINSVQANSPAAKAGLEQGDVITQINGDTVQSSLDVVRAVRSADPGDTLTVTYTRNGTTNTAKVTLGNTSSSNSSS